MSTEVMTKALLSTMLEQALVKIEENFDYLNQLDSATGDGDHGTAILTTMKAAVEAVKHDGTFSQVLTDIGWSIMKATGGSISSLLGAFYLGLGEAVSQEEVSPTQWINAFMAALKNVGTMTTAKIGDKTMMDALLPAGEAMQKVISEDQSASLEIIFDAAAKAARLGADSTKDLVAKQGRAKNLGERSVGHLDAGAISQAILFESFAQTIKSFE